MKEKGEIKFKKMIKNRNRETALEQQTYFWSVKNSSQEIIINFGDKKKKRNVRKLNRVKKFLFVFVTILGISFYDEAAKMNPIQEFRFAFVCFLSQRIA